MCCWSQVLWQPRWHTALLQKRLGGFSESRWGCRVKTPAGATQAGRLFRTGQMETVAVGRVGSWEEGTPGTWQLRAMCLYAYMPSGTGLSSDSASPSLRPNWTLFVYWSHGSAVQKQWYETSVSRWVNIDLDYLNYPHSLALLPPPLSADAEQLMSIQLMSPGNIGQVCWTRLPANRGACLLAPIRGRGDARGSCMAMSLIALKLCSYAHVFKYARVRVLPEVHLHCGSGELTCFLVTGRLRRRPIHLTEVFTWGLDVLRPIMKSNRSRCD